jgi:hypothetical protein
LVLDEALFSKYEQRLLFDDKKQLNPCIIHIVLKPEGKKGMDFQSFRN